MAGALALVILALLVGGGLLVAHYDPICHISCTGGFGVIGDSVTRLGQFTSPTGEDFTAYRVPHRPGGVFQFLFTLSNQGPIGVTITRIGEPFDPLNPLQLEAVRVENSVRRVSPDATLPFRPFSLGGGHYVYIWVTIQMRGCLGEQISMMVSTLPLTYRVLGVTRHTTIYLPEIIEVEGRPGESCG